MIWEIIGKFCAIVIVGKLLCFVWSILRSYLLPMLGWKIDFKSYGEWAVVTGATDGIGKAYAMELARMGLKVVLVSRSQEKLDSVASEINKTFGVETRTIAFNFGACDGYEKIENELSGLQIGVLINNVGMSYEYPEFFDVVSVGLLEKMLNVNMLSAVKMTHIVIKGMLERKKGIIVQVSSASSNTPVPFLTVYSASKAFMDFFGRALQMEYRNKGIICQSICPFFVATKLAGVRPSLTTPEPTDYVRQALGTIGNADRSYGYLMHTIQGTLYGMVPSCFSEKHIFDLMMKIRAKSLRKRNKKD